MPTLEQETNRKGTKAADPRGEAWTHLIHTFNHISEQLKALLDPFDITYQQYNVLRLLYDAFPGPLCGTEIKEQMLDKNPDVTRLCDRLENKGLIIRRDNKHNRRQIHVFVSEKGRKLLDEIEPQMRGKEYPVLRNLSSSEVTDLAGLLQKARV